MEYWDLLTEEHDEKKKLELYDKFVAQKYIDARPKSTLKLKEADFFKVICKEWAQEEDQDKNS